MRNNLKLIFNKIFGLNKVNEGYIGLTSFDKKEDFKEEKEELIPSKTSFTGMLKRV